MFKHKIIKYLEEKSESQNELSKKIGISASALSLYLKGEYKTPEALEIKISAFFELLETAKSYKTQKPEFMETSISKAIINAFTYCHLQKSMGIVYGDAGIGKTMSINEYARTHPEAVVIRASIAISKQLAFMKAISRKLKCSSGRRLDEIYLDIVEKLTGSEKIIIIDEAQHLNYSVLEGLRDIFDESGVPIVLVGNKEVYSKLLGKGEAAFAQLFSRNAIRKELTTNHVKKDDIKLIFPDLDSFSIDYLYSISITRWGVRGAVFTYMNAINNNDVSVSGLRKMTKLMGIVV